MIARKNAMRIVRRFWYILAFLVLALSLFICLSVSGILLPFYTSGSTSPLSSNTPFGAAPKPEESVQPKPPQLLGTLVIPAIDVNAPIESVGILPDGAMAVPVQRPWDGVGWYRYGPWPGAQGSAVIDGHLDRPGGYPAVFWKLRDLHAGDLVMVVNSGRQTLRFRVIQIAAYEPAIAPLQKIFRNNSGKFLNLITCAGTWIPSIHQTTFRLVVYTVLV
jgi:LPXTG-site transpeptidase (sortase) family protein